MARRLLLVAIAGAMSLIVAVSYSPGLRAVKQPEPPPAASPRPGEVLPITKVILFSSGVGYFERAGEVDDNARIDLRFPADQVNDLLKSLVLQDEGGGTVAAVSYDGQDPIEKTLHSFALDLSRNPTFGELLNQGRGERVDVTCIPHSHIEPNPCPGVIVGMEGRFTATGKEIDHLNLLCQGAIRPIPLDEIESVRFVNPTVQRGFEQALALLAGTHGTRSKIVSLSFKGKGRRRVRVGYVIDSPIWKASYRLVLDQKKEPFLQGWAIVDNPTDDDWSNIRLGLVSGRPISFKMNLYQPLYVPRPTVETKLFASLRPPSHDENLEDDDVHAAGGDVQGRAMGGLGGLGGGLGALGGGLGIGGGGMLGGPFAPMAGNPYQGPMARRQVDKKDRLTYEEMLKRQRGETPAKGEDSARPVIDPRQGVIAAAATRRVGDFFQYVIDHPVSLPRGKSALMPIVQQPVGAEKVSIFNAAVQSQFPLFAIRFKSTARQHLLEGPITIFDGGSYAGDAQLPDLQPAEQRLLSFAMDTGVEVKAETGKPADDLIAVKIAKGMVQAVSRRRQTTTYHLKSRTGQSRAVLIEHPVPPAEWTLVEPKPKERSRSQYRFEVRLPARHALVQNVIIEKTQHELYALKTADTDTVQLLLNHTATSPRVKGALRRAVGLHGKWLDANHTVDRLAQQLSETRADEARVRANLLALPQKAAAYQRMLDKLDAQERDIDATEKQLGAARAAATQRRREYEDYLSALSVD